jgi:curved DNA-binding protein CbpA
MEIPMADDLYRVLQVDPHAEPEVVDAAFRRLARKYHPDVNPTPEARERMRRITAAYEVLRDPDRRAAYNRSGHTGRALRRRESGSTTDAEPALELSLLGGLVGLDVRLRKRRL